MNRSLAMAMVAFVIMAAALHPAIAGQVWPIEDGFSKTANPNGVWTHGCQRPLGSALTTYNTWRNTVGIDAWCLNSNPDAYGVVTKNLTGSVFENGMYWAPGQMSLHPGPNDEKTTVRWTAPYATSVYINVSFFGANYAAGATTDVHVLLNGVDLFTGQVSGYGGAGHSNFGGSPIQSYSDTVAVAQGDRIDFAVGYGGNGYGSDMTGVTGWISDTPPAPAKPVINEVQSANSSTIADEDGDHSDWIEVHNAGGQSINLLDYGLSDDAAVPFKWTFPAYDLQPGEYLVVFASDKDRKTGPYFHTNYAIKSGGEPISLTAPDATLVSRIPATSIPQEMSYGRKPDGSEDLFYFAVPTPGAPNTTTGYVGTLTTPAFSRARGFYNSGFNLTLSTSVADGVIHYTTDGSEPTDASSTYSSPIAIPSASSGQAPRVTVVRARVTKTDYMPSSIGTNSYFVGPGSSTYYNLPIVSLATNNSNFFDSATGIWVNYNQDGEAWERRIHTEFFEPGGACGFHCDGGVRMHGGSSNGYVQKSLRLYADHQNGPGSFDYSIFPESTATDYKRIILRNNGNDNPVDPTYGIHGALMRDGLAQSLVNSLDVDCQYCRPGIVFFNGAYWGVFNIMEREDKYWIANRHPGVDPDNVDLIQQQPPYYPVVLEVAEGDLTALNAIRDYLLNNDLIVPANYEYVKTQMDVSSILIHHIAEIYYGNTDWPGNNIRYWRPRTPDGKWRWALTDCDITFSLWNPVTQNTLADATERGGWWPNGDAVCATLASLLRNRQSRDEFINRTADMLNTVFKESTVVAKIDSIHALLSPNMAAHFAKWGGISIPTWNSNVQALRDFANTRPGVIRSQYVEFFRLSGTANLTVSSSSASAGSVKVNTIVIPATGLPWQGIYFQDIPITLTAEPATGHRFVRWDGAGLGTQNPATKILSGDTAATAVFEPEHQGVAQ